MRWANYTIVFVCALLAGITVHAKETYREPNFSIRLFEGGGLSLSADDKARSASLLTALARNYSADASVSPRAKAMGLVLALHLVPEAPEALIGNYLLRRNLPPKATPISETKAAVVSELESIALKARANVNDEAFSLLLHDLLAELEHVPTSPAKLWGGAVAPPPQPLKRRSAIVAYIDPDSGKLKQWEIEGSLAESVLPSPSVDHEGTPSALPRSLSQRLKDRYPYIMERLQLSVRGRSEEELGAGERACILELLVLQLVEGWEWDSGMALCGLGGFHSPMELIQRIDRVHARKGDETEGLRMIVVPPTLNSGQLGDWMTLDKMERALSVTLLRAETASEIASWYPEPEGGIASEALFARCRQWVGKPLASPAQLAADRRVLPLLRQIAQQSREHVSSRALLDYHRLAGAFGRASKASSLMWLDDIGDRVMPLGTNRYLPSFAREVLRVESKRLREYRPRLHRETLPLVDALERHLERHAVPYCRVKNKGSSTARRQFAKLVGSITDWKRIYRQLGAGDE